SSAGLYTTALPAASAADDIPADRASGKLNGAMQANTPYGRRTSVFRSTGVTRPIARTNPPASATWSQQSSIRPALSSPSPIASTPLRVAHRLQAALADLERHDRRELVLPLANDLRGLLEDLEALPPG